LSSEPRNIHATGVDTYPAHNVWGHLHNHIFVGLPIIFEKPDLLTWFVLLVVFFLGGVFLYVVTIWGTMGSFPLSSAPLGY